jgi:hypothetical protein
MAGDTALMGELGNGNAYKMTDAEYVEWLRDYQKTVSIRLAKGARLPTTPEKVWQYWGEQAKEVNEEQELDTSDQNG